MKNLNRKYNPHADLSLRSCHIASLFYILGIGRDKFDSITIDDVVNLIRDKYVYKHDMSSSSASQEYIKKQNIILTRSIRRAWFDVQVANYEVSND